MFQSCHSKSCKNVKNFISNTKIICFWPQGSVKTISENSCDEQLAFIELLKFCVAFPEDAFNFAIRKWAKKWKISF